MEERRALDSWKEISDYLHRSIMTCQRWEKQLDLPIYRLDGTPKARVFAYSDELDRWLAEKLHAAEVSEDVLGKTARPRRPGALIAVAAASLLVLVVAAAWRFLLPTPIPAPAQVPSLAVLPFENRTGDSAWDAWKMALPDLMMIDLRQSKFMDVIKGSALIQAAGALAEAEKFSPEDLKKIAEKAEVEYALTGSFVRSGDEVIIAALVQNARTGEVVGSPRSTCRTEKDIFTGVDELSRGVKVALNVKPREVRGDIDKPVARITTKSPQAFVFFSQAYRIQGKRKFEDAITPLQKAVELDPQFGLAYRLLSYCCLTQSRKEDRKKYGEMAVRFLSRIEGREREVFLGDLYESEQLDQEKFVQAFQRLGKNYPYDPAMTGLTQFYMGREEWDKAIPIFEKLILRYPKRASVLQPLLSCYQAVGLYEKAEKILEDLSSTVPTAGREAVNYLSRRWALALAQRKYDVARDSADRLMTTFPGNPLYLSQKGFVYFMQDDLSNAEKMYEQLVANESPRIQTRGFEYLAVVSLSRGRVEEAKQRVRRAIEIFKGVDSGPNMDRQYRHFLAYLERLSGRLPEALNEAERACAVTEGQGGVRLVQMLYLRALITLEMNRLDEFEKQIEEIKGYLDPDRFFAGAPRYMRIYFNLLGHRELRKNNYDLAIRYFWKALDLLSVLAASSVDADHAKYFYDLAEAYRRSGNNTNALAMYEKVALPTVSREFSGDLYARSYYWMGLDSERQMRSAAAPAVVQERRLKAIGYFRKFLELWKDADPIFPEVEDARQRLARLEAR